MNLVCEGKNPYRAGGSRNGVFSSLIRSLRWRSFVGIIPRIFNMDMFINYAELGMRGFGEGPDTAGWKLKDRRKKLGSPE